MKSRQWIIPLLVAVLLAAGCDREEVYPTYDQPGWVETFDGDYNASMTAVLRLPDNLAPYVAAGDELAAFIGDECRGVGQQVDGLWYVMLKGTPDEQGMVSIRYYSAANRYLYRTAEGFEFESDGVYGTADNPVTLSLVTQE